MSVDARVDRLREPAAEAGLDAMLVTSPPSISYLTGLDGCSSSGSSPSSSTAARRRR